LIKKHNDVRCWGITLYEGTIFDIETYRVDWKIRRTRREDFDPANNTIITFGLFDGRNVAIYPIIENLNEEKTLIESFFEKLQNVEIPILVGYNILHFDIPHLVYKINSIGKKIDISRFKPLDLYWILPYWLQNSSGGRKLATNFPGLGKLWRLDDVVQKILGLEPNPFPNQEIFSLWEARRFSDIEKHLERDLHNTFALLNSPVFSETIGNERIAFDKNICDESCPFRRPLQKTSEKAVQYCTLLRQEVSNEVALSAIDVVDYPLPVRNVSWSPPCKK
jgi:DNA polymerase elongation subunit (family B)